MRQSMMGDWFVESTEDDPGFVLSEAGEEIFAEVFEDEEAPGRWLFEVRENDSGDTVLSCDSIFETQKAARDWIKQYVSDVQLR